MIEEAHPWSYTARAGELLGRATSALDMDTGGGERLLALRLHWPARMVASEAYPPNVTIAAKRLAPAGVALVTARSAEDQQMPFRDGAFDLVLNRHGGFKSAEIGRVLARGGVFFTEQVHGMWAHDLLSVFGIVPNQPIDTAEYYASQLRAAGLHIRDIQDFSGRLQFLDVGAIVYYLKAIPWMVPGFSVATHADVLLRLQERLQLTGELVFTARLYILEAIAD